LYINEEVIYYNLFFLGGGGQQNKQVYSNAKGTHKQLNTPRKVNTPINQRTQQHLSKLIVNEQPLLSLGLLSFPKIKALFCTQGESQEIRNYEHSYGL